jgi:Acetyltransferase (GNAT) domain
MTLPALRTPRAPGVRPEVLRGPSLLRLLRHELPRHAGRWQVPLTMRTGWLTATMTARRDLQPWAVALRDPRGQLRGVIALADEVDTNGRLTTTLLGTDRMHRGAVLADDEAAAYELGIHLEAAMLKRPRLGALHLGPLAADDPRVRALAAGTGVTVAVAVEPVPIVRRQSCLAADHLSAGTRRTLRKSANRLRADGRTTHVDVVTDRATIRGCLPALVQHHQARDHAHGRDSAVDDPAGAALWHHRAEALLNEGLELAQLTIDGQLAAYVLGVPDGTAYRLLDGRFVGTWARYAPGRLLETAVLQRVLDDPRLSHLDWMTAVAPETLLTHNTTNPMVALELRQPA